MDGDSEAAGVGEAVEEFELTDGIGGRELGAGMAAGLLGMVAMAPVLLVGYFLGLNDFSAFAGLAELMYLGSSVPLGFAVYVVGGAVAFPLFFITIGMFIPGSTTARKGMSFGAIVWTGSILGLYTGQSGLTFAGYLVFGLLAHLAYGFVLGEVYGRYAHIVEHDV